MTIKFSGLNAIATPADADLFALSDTSATESKKITFANLKTSIIDASTFSSSGPNIPLIITGLNAYDSGSGNALKASQLYHSGSYRDASYFLTYGNISGAPSIPTDVPNQ